METQHDFDGKNKAAILAYGGLEDKSTFGKVLAALKFPEDRAEVARTLGM